MLDLLKNSKTGMETLHYSVVRTDGGTQMRAELNTATIDEYAQAIQAGTRFPPIVVYYDGESYWLGDGFHRLAAHKKIFMGGIECEVRSGTRRDAVLCAAGANAAHGLRRTNADKRRAVEALLRDEEWAQWSDREIARKCAVHHELVGTVRTELSGGNRQMAETRTVQRNGTTYQQQTANIAAANRERKTVEYAAPVTQPTNQPVVQPVAVAPLRPLAVDVEPHDRRLPLATTMRDSITELLQQFRDYGWMTGCYTDIPPAERSLRKIRNELEKLINLLSGVSRKTEEYEDYAGIQQVWEGDDDARDA